jgi:hypothetical protein
MHGVTLPRNRAHGAEEQNRSRLITWAAKQENFQPKEMYFFLTSTFIELTRHVDYFRFALVLNRTRVLAEQWSWACSSARVRLSG